MCLLWGNGIRAVAYSRRLPKNKWADHQMLPPEPSYNHTRRIRRCWCQYTEVGCGSGDTCGGGKTLPPGEPENHYAEHDHGRSLADRPQQRHSHLTIHAKHRDTERVSGHGKETNNREIPTHIARQEDERRTMQRVEGRQRAGQVPINEHACISVSFRSVTPTITVNRSRSFRLTVNVSLLWPGCYPNPGSRGTFESSYQGDILMEFRQYSDFHFARRLLEGGALKDCRVDP